MSAAVDRLSVRWRLIKRRAGISFRRPVLIMQFAILCCYAKELSQLTFQQHRHALAVRFTQRDWHRRKTTQRGMVGRGIAGIEHFRQYRLRMADERIAGVAILTPE